VIDLDLHDLRLLQKLLRFQLITYQCQETPKHLVTTTKNLLKRIESRIEAMGNHLVTGKGRVVEVGQTYLSSPFRDGSDNVTRPKFKVTAIDCSSCQVTLVGKRGFFERTEVEQALNLEAKDNGWTFCEDG
jgi:hypothetical protein